MPLGPPVDFPNVGERWVCEACGERWHEDNIDECLRCKRDVCAYCGGSGKLPGWSKDVWLCRGCRDVINKDSTQAPVPPPPVPKLFWPVDRANVTARDIAVHNLKIVMMKDGGGNLYVEWTENEQLREVLTKSLEVLGFDIEKSGKDLDVVPGEVPQGPALLVFTVVGTKLLSATIGEFTPVAG